MLDANPRAGTQFIRESRGGGNLSAADGAPPAIDDSRDLGLMLWDIVFGPKGNRAVFFEAKLERGVLSVSGLWILGFGFWTLDFRPCTSA